MPNLSAVIPEDQLAVIAHKVSMHSKVVRELTDGDLSHQIMTSGAMRDGLIKIATEDKANRDREGNLIKEKMEVDSRLIQARYIDLACMTFVVEAARRSRQLADLGASDSIWANGITLNPNAPDAHDYVSDSVILGIARYLCLGIKPGGFLVALFSNDFLRASTAADPMNRNLLPFWGRFLTSLPPHVFGSEANVYAYCKSVKEHGVISPSEFPWPSPRWEKIAHQAITKKGD